MAQLSQDQLHSALGGYKLGSQPSGGSILQEIQYKQLMDQMLNINLKSATNIMSNLEKSESVLLGMIDEHKGRIQTLENNLRTSNMRMQTFDSRVLHTEQKLNSIEMAQGVIRQPSPVQPKEPPLTVESLSKVTLSKHPDFVALEKKLEELSKERNRDSQLSDHINPFQIGKDIQGLSSQLEQLNLKHELTVSELGNAKASQAETAELAASLKLKLEQIEAQVDDRSEIDRISEALAQATQKLEAMEQEMQAINWSEQLEKLEGFKNELKQSEERIKDKIG